ncbi:hypothetical protein PsYK624_090620 [Phanerochaete sordida]|uniref:Uncharacterized protein n=1 Tax=Phanerochaete sordida TaxID=48140 RepID=A0A9P3LFR4_9APHY|nr:hypothetical protein PsYK624_090620 [Phanerochaete sordida]
MADSPGICIPQKYAFYNSGQGYEQLQAVVFPPETSLKRAAAGSLASDASYQERVTVCKSGVLKFILRLEWPGYPSWSCFLHGTDRVDTLDAGTITQAALAKRIANAIKQLYEEHACVHFPPLPTPADQILPLHSPPEVAGLVNIFRRFLL